MNIALLLSTAFVTTLPPARNRERRIRQYIDGLGQVAEVSARYPIFDVFSVDSTIDDESVLDVHLLDSITAIPGLKGRRYFNDNEMGRINKGSGLVVQWA